MALRQFIGTKDVSASAGDYPHIQLWNAADSGIIMKVSRVWAVSGAPTNGMLLSHHATELGSMSASNVTPRENIPGTGNSRISQFLDTSLHGDGNVCRTDNLLAGHGVELIKNPLTIPQGNSLLLAAILVNVGLGVIFEWDEIDA
jgi:hypothetical protein